MTTKELRKLAEAATQGEWEAEGALVWEREGLSIASTHNSKCAENAAYIAAASPTAIIEILDRVDAVEKMLKSEQEYGIYWRERAEELKEQTP